MTILQQYQIESHLATDGQEAFDFVKMRYEETSTMYNLIIMDVHMPICDGFKSADMIRAYVEAMSEQQTE